LWAHGRSLGLASLLLTGLELASLQLSKCHQGATLSNDVVLDCCLTACAWIGVISRTSVQAIAAATLMETPALNIRVFGKLSKRKPRRGLREP
jgi:hypothetical protein